MLCQLAAKLVERIELIVNKNVQRLGGEQILAIISSRVPNSLTSVKMNLITKEQVNHNHKLLDDYKRQFVTLTEKQFQVAIGVLLGDASLQSQDNGKTYRLKFEQGDNHKDYINHLYSIFFEWSLSPPRRQDRKNKKGHLVTTWTFQTFSHSAFLPLASIFLVGKNIATDNWKKGISENFVEKYMTPLVFAYWFMDDGGKMDYGKNSGKALF